MRTEMAVEDCTEGDKLGMQEGEELIELVMA
jgi:hypothetical protein